MHATKFFWNQQAVAKIRKNLDPDILSVKAPTYAGQLALVHGGTRWRSLARQAADLVAYLSENGLTIGMASLCQCPALVSVGDRDELVSVREAQRLSQGIPEGALLVLPGVRHPFRTLGRQPLLPVMQRFHLQIG
jgi:hypothetical protein